MKKRLPPAFHFSPASVRFTSLLAFIFWLSFIPNSLWAKTPKQLTPPASDMQQFAGTYHLLGNQNLSLAINTSGNGLLLKELWSNREIKFTRKADLNFVGTADPDFTLDFAQDKSGAINQVTAFKKDIWVKVNSNAAEKKLSNAEVTRLNQVYQKLFAAFQEAINANATDKIQSFIRTYLDKTLVTALTMENLTLRAKEMYQKSGGIELDTSKPINPETGTATFKGKNQGNLFQMSFTLNPAGKIINFGMQE